MIKTPPHSLQLATSVYQNPISNYHPLKKTLLWNFTPLPIVEILSIDLICKYGQALVEHHSQIPEVPRPEKFRQKEAITKKWGNVPWGDILRGWKIAPGDVFFCYFLFVWKYTSLQFGKVLSTSFFAYFRCVYFRLGPVTAHLCFA